MQYPTTAYFSRQQLQTITNISDDVLGYWMKEGLLVPEAADNRKHRRFRYGQLHIAVVLESIRSLGANITVLRAFASKMQRGATLTAEGGIRSDQILAVTYLAKALQRFRRREPVEITNPAWISAGGHQVNSDEIPMDCLAKSEEEIAEHYIGDFNGDDLGPLVPFVSALSQFEAEGVEMFGDLISEYHINGQIDNYNNVWIAWIDSMGEARLVSGEDANIGQLPPHAAFFLPISRIINRMWLNSLPVIPSQYI